MGSHRTWFGWQLLLALLAAPQPTVGQPVSDPPAPAKRHRLPEVFVSASRTPGVPLNASEFPGNATILTADAIERSGARSIPELVGTLEGVTTMDTHGFGLGADASVNLRGIVNSSRTGALVLLNGVRQNRLTGDEVHWQSIPLHHIERIEVIRGGGGLGYGEGALSGVINIVTKTGAEGPLRTEHTVELGSFGQRVYATSARGSAGSLTYGTSLHRKDVSGYRESTNSRTVTTTSHLGLELLPKLRIDTNVLHSEDTSYFPGGITPLASQQRRRQRGSFAGFFEDETTQVSLDTHLTGPWGLSGAITSFWRDRESDSDTAGSRFATIAPSRGLSVRASHDAALEELRHSFVASVDLLDEKASVGTRGLRFDESNKASYGLWFEETLRLLNRATLTAGLRYDKSRFAEDISFPAFVGTLRFQGLSPMVGLSVDVAKPLTLYARYARPFKAPSVDDFSAVVPNDFVGNINLQPQQADDYELGLRVTHERLGSYKVAWFYNRIDDEILFNASAGQNQNVDTERIGLETSWELPSLLPRLKSRVTYTFLEAEFRKGSFKGNTIPGVPEHRLTASLTYEPIPHVAVTMDWLLVQDVFRVNDFRNILPGDNYGVLNLGLRFEYETFRVYFTVTNVTNEEYTSFQSSNGSAITTGENPSPPIAFLGGITITF